MSSIPTSAMRRAFAHDDADGSTTRVSRRQRVMDAARARPKTAIAAGAALVASLAAAAAVPLVRSRRRAETA
ncbi:hypothetical protein [Sphingosinicella sp. LY1275]|uniref:hypothetical protein n=1 Tax=Sphingosinicella sp. LY1275 TaxID=3095379 RepID=UPI002ADEF144|nr:hypothetical protein [Sphingosinicella sp. LY1275]MEA1015071.1 hypothetical protein [Sphingosinicella sp. LY1275]